jgi:nicotinamidase-related amidase
MKLIVVVDMQNEFLNWQRAEDAARILKDARAYLDQEVQDPDTLIVFTQDTHYKDVYEDCMESTLYALHCEYGTPGWELANEFKEFAKLHDIEIIKKSTYVLDWFGLSYAVAKFCGERGHKFDEIEVFGLCKDICVLANLISLNSDFPTATISCLDNLCLATSAAGNDAADTIMDKMGFKHKFARIVEK